MAFRPRRRDPGCPTLGLKDGVQVARGERAATGAVHRSPPPRRWPTRSAVTPTPACPTRSPAGSRRCRPVSLRDISEVARSSGHVLADTAAVHFQLGEQLLLDWLRQRILELPREDHWQALARGALRDTLYEVTGCRPAQSSRPHYPLYAVSGQTTGTEVPDPVRSL
jgi:hypothetical protein